MKDLYEDILYLPRHVSHRHPPMPMEERAAQFSPFAALTGYEAVIRETARLTEARPELGEWEQADLERKVRFLGEHEAEQPEIAVTWFRPDERKEGGSQVRDAGRLRRIDPAGQTLELENSREGRRQIPLADILELEGDCFPREDS